MRITGVSSGRKPSRSDATTREKRNGAPRGSWRRSATIAIQAIRAAPIRRPGIRPAMRMPPTDTFAIRA